MTLIGKILKDRRKSFGFTQRFVAKGSGMAVQNYSRIERGKVTPTQSTLSAICRALSLDPETLAPIDKSAWDELAAIRIIAPLGLDLTPFHVWSEKYKSELKRIPAKE